MKLMSGLILFIALTSLTSCASPKQDPGIQAYMRSDWDNAIVYFSDALRLDPNNIEARKYRGYSYLLKGMPEEAIIDFSELIARDPQNASVYYVNRSSEYLAVGNYARAIEDCDKALATNPASLPAKSNKASALARMGRVNEALSIYEQEINKSPSISLYMMRGRLYVYLKDYSHAIADYTEAINLSKGKGEGIYQMRGSAYRNLGDYDRAIADFDRAISLRPDVGSNYYEKAVTFDESGRTKDALKTYREFLSLQGKVNPSADVIQVLAFGVIGLMTLPSSNEYIVLDKQKKHAEERIRDLEARNPT